MKRILAALVVATALSGCLGSNQSQIVTKHILNRAGFAGGSNS